MTGNRAQTAWIARAALLAGLICGNSPLCGQWGVGGMGGVAGMGGVGGMAGVQDDPTSGTAPDRIALRPWISAHGLYFQSLGQEVTGAARRGTYGYGGAAGVSGGRSWERTTVGGFYTASYQRRSGGGGIAGGSQVFGVTVSHRATDRVSVFASQFAGSTLGGFGYGATAGALGGWGVTGSAMLANSGLIAGPIVDFADNGLVDNELFGTRVNFYGTSGGVGYRMSRRWFVGGGAQAGFVRRKGPGLRDLNSAGVHGSASYQLGARTGIGFGYGMTRFSYPGVFGDNRAQFAGAGFSHALSPKTSISLSGGMFRLNTRFIGVVQIDPLIAELLGVAQQVEVQRRAFEGWMGSASVRRTWREWGASVAYAHGLNPGNGVVLTSRRDSVVGGAGRAYGRVGVGVFGGYFRWSGILEGAKVQSGSAGASSGIRVVSDLYVGVNSGYSVVQAATGPRRWSRFVSAHLTWSPSFAAFRF